MSEIIITHSDLKTFLSCRRTWYWTYVQDFRPVEKTYGALALGTRVHAAIEQHYLGNDPHTAYDNLCATTLKQMEDAGRPEYEFDQFYEDMVVGRNCVIAFMDWLAETDADAPYTVEKVEETVEAPILGGKVKIRGKVDVLFREDASGFLRINDLKTNGKWTLPREWLERSWQHWLYIIALRLSRPEEIVHGADYTVINKVKDMRRTKRNLVTRFPVPGMTRMADNKLKQLEAICREMLRAMEEIETMGVAQAYPSPQEGCTWCDFKQPCELLDESPLAARAMLDREFARSERHKRYGKV